jgi:hypothetical protein
MGVNPPPAPDNSTLLLTSPSQHEAGSFFFFREREQYQSEGAEIARTECGKYGKTYFTF